MRRMLAQADMEGKSLYVVCSRGSFGRDPFLTGLAASGYRSRQLRNIRRDLARLVARESHSESNTRPWDKTPYRSAGVPAPSQFYWMLKPNDCPAQLIRT